MEQKIKQNPCLERYLLIRFIQSNILDSHCLQSKLLAEAPALNKLVCKEILTENTYTNHYIQNKLGP